MALRMRAFGGSNPVATPPPVCPSFSDTFNRDDGAGWGVNWTLLPLFSTGAALFNLQAVYTSFRTQSLGTGGPFARITTGIGLTNATLRVLAQPWPLINDCLNGQKQFSEIQISVDQTALPNLNQYGPGVFLIPTESTPTTNLDNPLGYPSFGNIATGTWALVRQTETATNTILSVPGVFVAPSTLRIEITPSPASNFIELFVNGGSVGSVTDSAANRRTTGFPGFYVRGINTVGLNTDFVAYSGGPF